MTVEDVVGPATHMVFRSPMTEERANRIAADLAATGPATVADYACGWGDILDHVVAAGFRPLRIESSTRAEWEDYESLETRDSEEWLLANPGHPDAAEVRNQLDDKRGIWLRGHRDYFGFAMLTLGVPVR